MAVPAGPVRAPGVPRRGTLGAAAVRAPGGISGWGDTGGAPSAAPETPGKFSRAPGAAEERAGPGRDRTALRSEDGFTPVCPLLMFPLSFARRANYYTSSVIHIPLF